MNSHPEHVEQIPSVRPKCGGMTGNVPQMGLPEGLSGQKRKASNLLDTPGGESGSRFRRIAPMPGTGLRSTDTSPGHSLGFDGKPEQRQPIYTSMAASPTLAAGGIFGHLPRSGNGVLSDQEGQAMDRPVSGEEGLTHLICPASDTRCCPQRYANCLLGFPTSNDFASQASSFGYSDAPGHAGSTQSQLASPFDGQQFGQGWTENSGAPLVTCPWRSHLEMIMSIELDISRISRLHSLSSITMEPPLKEGFGVLLDHLLELKRSYFTLQEAMQPSKSGNIFGWAT